MLSTIRHYGTQLMLMLWGPAQLDEQNDPMMIEDRKYEAEQRAEHEHPKHHHHHRKGHG